MEFKINEFYSRKLSIIWTIGSLPPLFILFLFSLEKLFWYIKRFLKRVRARRGTIDH